MEWEWLTALTYLAGALLCLYLFLFIAGVAALFYFLNKGLRWVNIKTDWLLGRAVHYSRLGNTYALKGLDIAAQPEIRATAGVHAAGAFLKRLFGR